MNVAVRSTATQPDHAALKAQAARLRGKIIEMSHAAQAAHLASSLSCAGSSSVRSRYVRRPRATGGAGES